MSFVYRKHEPGLYTVGFYTPDGEWEEEPRHAQKGDAVQRTTWLNGGGEPDGPAGSGVDLVPLIRMVRAEMAERVAEALECTHCRQIARRIAKREGEATA